MRRWLFRVRMRTVVGVTCAIGLAACQGQIVDGAALGGGPGGPADSPPDGREDDRPLTPPSCETTGPRMVRRLTSDQYRESLAVLFDDPEVPAGTPLTDPVVHGFTVDATQAVVRGLGAQQLMQSAERVARWAVEEKLDGITPCRRDDAACRRAFIADFGARVYREPLAAGTVDAYQAIFEAEASFEAGVEAVVATMLQSPKFLYRRELGVDDGAGGFELTPWELASNLSYTVTNRPPDEALRAAAADGRLETEDDLVREARRLLATPGAAEQLAHFALAWLEVDDLLAQAKDESSFAFPPELRQAMLDETSAFFVDLVRGGGSFADVFLAEHTFVDQRLAPVYGFGWETGAALERVDLGSSGRAPGVLGQGSVLSRHSLSWSTSPVFRGLLVRERFLCDAVPAPPADVETTIPEPLPGEQLTTRQRYERHRTDPTCARCHVALDPIGYAFERFDHFGRWRDQDAGQPIDTTGNLVTPEGDVPLDGIESLAEHLAQSRTAQACFVDHLAYFAYGIEGCDQEAAVTAAREGSLEDALLALIRSPHLRRRQATED